MDNTTPSEEQHVGLYLRADGFAEDPEGNIAVVMMALTQSFTVEDRKINRLRYRVTFTSEPITIDWPADETVALLPVEVVNGLLGKGYARKVTPEEVTTFNAAFASEPEPKPAPVSSTAKDGGSKAAAKAPSEPQAKPPAETNAQASAAPTSAPAPKAADKE